MNDPQLHKQRVDTIRRSTNWTMHLLWSTTPSGALAPSSKNITKDSSWKPQVAQEEPVVCAMGVGRTAKKGLTEIVYMASAKYNVCINLVFPLLLHLLPLFLLRLFLLPRLLLLLAGNSLTDFSTERFLVLCPLRGWSI